MSYSFDAQRRLIEEKKRQLLMKTSNKSKQQEPPKIASQNAVSSSTPPPAVGPNNVFANDGNFLARFQAMQKQGSQSENHPKPYSEPDKSKEKLSIKLSNPKNKEKPKLLAATSSSTMASSAFENPAVEEDGKRIKENDSAYNQTYASTSSREQGEKETSLLQGKRRRKNRWDEQSDDQSASSTFDSSQQGSSTSGHASTSSSTENPADIMLEFQRAKALVQQKAAEAKNALSAENLERQRQIEEQKRLEAVYRKVIEEQAAEAKRNRRKRERENKPRYEYDSDEDVEGGTWEHKKRIQEMTKTSRDATKLTEMAKGKHHMSDFLPKEELAKFQEKVRAVKEGRKADLSDYAEHKIKEDNIGFKLLQKAGWQEGKGLGSGGKGITEPVNKGQTSLDNSGVGAEKPQEVSRDDDEFDIYRKRMMLAYKFRPNPLNNPRRPYY